MVVIELNFLTGRFHATPWDRQVNEGAVEWPPSPWRLLRALMATWHSKGQELGQASEWHALLLALTPAPLYWLPPTVQAHTRHYMPIRDGGTAKVFDTFVHLGDARSLRIIWPNVELTMSQRGLLASLLDRLGYFGRAESWAEGHLLDSWDGEATALPLGEGEMSPPGYEQVRLLAPASPEAFATWRQETITRHEERRLAELKTHAFSKGKPVEAVKLSPKERAGIAEALPSDVIAALSCDTGELRKAGWSQPPGSRWVSYMRPIDAFAVHHKKDREESEDKVPNIARYAVNGAVLPSITEAVSLGERVRSKLMSHSKEIRGNAAPVFSGKSDEGNRLDSNHQHAHILPETNGARDRVTHLVIHAPMGFDEKARIALGRLSKIREYGRHDLQLVLLGLGRQEDFGGFAIERGLSPLLATSGVWRSQTPFVLMRYPKTYRDGRPKLREDGRQVDGPEAQLLSELEKRGLPAPVRIDPIPAARIGGHELRWLMFQRERKHGGGAHVELGGHGFRLTFEQPVSGPIALGYACHYGLGLFVPEAP